MAQADVLIVTVTDVEFRAVVDAARTATGRDAKPQLIGHDLYLDLGEINGSRVFMALSGMGSGGVGGSQERVRKGIEALSPSAVIMVGIAFGINEQKQAIGDVLVSERLMLYDLQRRGTDDAGNLHIIPRGDRASSAPRLFTWFRMASQLNWDQSERKVRFGLVLSGEHLVDNIDYRGELLALEKEAIGGEMEGAGLYVACQNAKVDWILVKAICGWADGKKEVDRDARQQKAAHNAAAFVVHALQQAPLKPSEPPLQQFGIRAITPRTVFISYAREDSAFARRLGEDLRASGIDVWIDQINIRGGELWDQAVETALASSAAVIVVLTPAAVTSRSVLDEVAYALDENKTVTPVFFQKCSIPLRLRRLHYTDFTSDYSAGLAELRRSLTSATSENAVQTQTAPIGSEATWEQQARSLAAQGLKINAIKLVRDRTGVGVKAAKDLVDSWPSNAMWEREARALAAQGKKINAIKLVREMTGLGLKEAKDLVESW